MNENSGYTSINNVAEFFQVHPDTIRRMIRAKKIPAIHFGKSIRIPKKVLTPDFLAEIKWD